MNWIIGFNKTVRTELIVTLLLAAVMAAGCPKKQGNASSPPANEVKSPAQDTQIKTPVVEANAPVAAALPTEPAADKAEATADKTPPEAADATSAVEEQKTDSSSQLKAPVVSGPADLKPLESLKTADEKIDFMIEFADTHPESIPALVYKALDDSDLDVRTSAVDLLAMIDEEYADDPNIISIAVKAMKDTEPEIRQRAIEACDSVTDPKVGGVLVSAIADKSEDVRAAAIQIADQKEPAVRLLVLKAGITSRYDDVKEAAVSSLSDVSSPAAMDILITGLKDPNPDFREEVKSAISFLVSQDFDTYDQAKKWWNANRNKFDDELAEKD